MELSFVILAVLVLVSAVAAMTLRNLIHCALSAALTFVGLAGLYLQLNAQFVGFAQILVYVGAIAILIVFAILLTRGTEPSGDRIASSSWWGGIACALGVFGVLGAAILSARHLGRDSYTVAVPTVKQIGMELMTSYVLPLQIVGLLLTVAMIGAVVLALPAASPSQPGSASSDETPLHDGETGNTETIPMGGQH